MGLLYYLSYVAVVAAFAFVTLSLASGLLYVSELIEEYSNVAKSIGQRGIYAIIALHIVLYCTDSLPLLHMLFSITCHIVYLQNFSHAWPNISLTSRPFIASCALVILDHFLWFFYFARKSNELKRLRTYQKQGVHGFTEIAAFFGICVWLAPLFLFLSLSANDNALPISATSETMSPIAVKTSEQMPSRVSLVRHLFSSLSFSNVPNFRPRHLRKNTSEGIIAPRSPITPRTPLPHSSPSIARFTACPSRSPGPYVQEIDLPLSPNSGFQLTPAPRRTIQRRFTGDPLGLGISTRKSNIQAGVGDNDVL